MELPSKATHQATREHNVRLVLRALANLGPISRADIARRTQLTRTTVSDVVTQLSGAGLVQEVGRGPSSGGKAPILLQIPRDARQVVGVHVGDGHVRGAIVNLAGDVSHRERVELPARDGASALASLEGLIDRLVGHATGLPLGIGIGTPGIVETATGTVRWAVHLDWRDLRLGPRLQARTGLPVYVANDSQAAALAEWTFGGHSTARAMVAVRVGTGIGAGIVIDDRLYQGDGAGAGEIGHTTVTSNDIRCRCGRTGCLETVASMPATLERVRVALGTESRPELGRGGRGVPCRPARGASGGPRVGALHRSRPGCAHRHPRHPAHRAHRPHDHVRPGLVRDGPRGGPADGAAAARGDDPHHPRQPRARRPGAGSCGTPDDRRAGTEQGGMSASRPHHTTRAVADATRSRTT